MNKAFTPRAVAGLKPKIQGIVDALIDRVVSRGAMDVIADFAYPIPASVIMVMLGVPRRDLDSVKRWSDDMALFVGSSRLSADKYRRAQSGMRQMAQYFRAVIAARRAVPEDDLISAMLLPEPGGPGVSGDVFSEDELIATCSLLLFAGHETTTNLIGNGIWALLNHPTEQQRLAGDPSLVESAVEEMLRWDGPSHALARLVASDVELAGKQLRRGERVFAMINAANRDPAVFSDPHRFDVARQPNRHLTFAAGIHFCLGAPLARLEGQIAIATLLRRLADLRLADQELDWLDSMILRGVKSLKLSFRPV